MKAIITVKDTDNIIGLKEDISMRLEGVADILRIDTIDVTPNSEVAREIFEEIERFLYLHFRFCKEEIGNDDAEYVKGRMELNTQIQNFIAELKKRYTEGNK